MPKKAENQLNLVTRIKIIERDSYIMLVRDEIT